MTMDTESQTVQNAKLFAVFAHDVKGPIETMRLALSHIISEKKTISEEEIDSLLGRFEQELTSVSEMLNNLLTWVKERQYGLSVHPTMLSLHDETELSLEVLRSFARQKGIELVNHIDKELILHTDKDMLQVILRNLISNAIKFSHPQNAVTMEVMREGEMILVSVSDEGIGMSDEIKHKILNNQKVKSGYGTAKEKGIGLGLSICKEFIEKLGGKMNIRSMGNKGTVMCFTLPV